MRGAALLFLLAGTALGVVSCEGGDREITVTERRELTLFDRAYLEDIKDHPPAAWRRLPLTPMRYYNYRFGEDESGEVWLSAIQVRGPEAILQNANRWYGQFGLPPTSSLETLAQEEMLGTTGYLVEAEGTYQDGMGAAPRENTAMLAAAIPREESIVTVKMIGSPEDVTAQRDAFLEYCKSLEGHDVLSIPETDEQ